MRKLIIDTDPGHDDALAILLLELSGLFEILAITTVAGNSGIQSTHNNARYVLDLVGSRTPLHSGAAKPLVRDLILAEVHGENGLAGAAIEKQEPLTHDAAAVMGDLIRRHPGEVTVLTLGPQTNLATALRNDPALAGLIKEVVMMGGAIAVPGNKNRVAEFNIFLDPEAADIVFESPAPKVLVPLDACNDIALLLSDFDKLKGTPLHAPLMAMMDPYIKGIAEFEKTVGALMYDPLAAYYLVNPQAYRIQEFDVRIETHGQLTRGMTVADRRRWGIQEPNVSVVSHIDRDAFTEDFLRILATAPSLA